MSVEHLVVDGLSLLNNINVQQLEERVEWLEKTLQAYKTMLIVRKMMALKPDDFQLPREFQSLIPINPPATRQNRTRHPDVSIRIMEVLKTHPDGISKKTIEELTGLSSGSVSAFVGRRIGIDVERIGHGIYRLTLDERIPGGDNHKSTPTSV